MSSNGCFHEAVITTAVPVVDPEVTRAEMEAQLRHSMETEIRQTIMEEAVRADAVAICSGDEDGFFSRKIKGYWKIGLLVLILIGIVVGLCLGFMLIRRSQLSIKANSDQTTAIAISRPTLELVRERGYIRCMVNPAFLGFTERGPTGLLQGLNVDHCRALSVAVFGNPDQYELVETENRDYLEKLQDGSVDVVAQQLVMRMGTDVYDPTVGTGFTYSIPYFFTGFAFVGRSAMVKCADRLDSYSRECRALRICVVSNTANENTLQNLLPGGMIVPCSSGKELTQKFVAGECNVIGAQASAATEERFRKAGYEGDFEVGKHLFSFDAVALISRNNDVDWANTIDLVLHTFFVAEAHNITQANAADMRTLFRGNHHNNTTADVMVDVVSQFGNYGDLYMKHLESVVPRRGLNLVYTKYDTSGLLYSLDFHDFDHIGPGPIPLGTIDSILTRGHLICGIYPRPGFAEASPTQTNSWSGLDVELCSALAAAMFAGNASAVVFVDLVATNADGIAVQDENVILRTGTVDVVAGSRVSLKGIVGDGSPGFVFGPPYFVDTESMSQYAFMTRADDCQWTSFVYWVTTAIIHAEKSSITQVEFHRMPITLLFGEILKLCFQDAISAVGNYGEIYNRTLEATSPRSGGNLLNQQEGSSYGPQHFAIPIY
eukprot:Sro1070_g237740.2  (661) ;mRNA; r:13714-15696